MRPVKVRSVNETVVAFVAAAVGAACAMAPIAANGAFADAYKESPKLLAWLVLIGAQGGIAGFALVAIVGLLVRLQGETCWQYQRPALLIALSVTAFVMVETLIAPMLFHRAWIAPLGADQGVVMSALSIAFAVPAFLAMFAMWLVALGTQPPSDDANPIAVVVGLEQTRDRIRMMLYLLGLQVGGATLATGGLRTAVLAMKTDDGTLVNEGTFPVELVLAYGGCLTLLVAMCFVPAYLHVQRVAEIVRGRAMDKVDQTDASKWFERRRDLTTQLGLDAGAIQTFRDVVAIAAPLIAGFVSFALPSEH